MGHDVIPLDTAVRVAAREKRDTTENPLWVINIAMAAFFITAALVMMAS
jgi:hypothetical protein